MDEADGTMFEGITETELEAFAQSVVEGWTLPEDEGGDYTVARDAASPTTMPAKAWHRSTFDGMQAACEEAYDRVIHAGVTYHVVHRGRTVASITPEQVEADTELENHPY